jgi:hypothetical protein
LGRISGHFQHPVSGRISGKLNPVSGRIPDFLKSRIIWPDIGHPKNKNKKELGLLARHGSVLADITEKIVGLLLLHNNITLLHLNKIKNKSIIYCKYNTGLLHP